MLLAVIAISWVVGTAEAAPPDLKGKTLQKVFNELLPGMGAADFGARREPQQTWQAICLQAGAPGNEGVRAEACRLMIEKLGPETPTPTRDWLLRQLEHIGRGESVNAVAALLTDKDDLVRAAAIRCLTSNPAAEATAKLLTQVPGAVPADRVALLNALGHRADQAAIPVLAKEIASPEAAVAGAAARALGRIGTPEAEHFLAARRGQTTGPVRAALDDAWLRCADRRLQEGQTAAAAVIYRELNRPEEPRPLRLAALRGALRSAGAQAGAMTLDVLGGSDPAARAIAISEIMDLSAGALKTVAANFDQLPPAVQAAVLGALAARGDRSQMPAAVAAVKSADDNVRQAALRALGRLGDASVVPLLVDTLFTNPKLAGAARESLARLTSPGVDEQLIARLRSKEDAGKHGALIAVLETRKTVAAVPVLLQIAGGGSAELRPQALAALRQLAAPQDLPAMLRVLLRAKSSREREEAERAVAVVCLQIPEAGKRAEPVLAVYRSASKGEQATLLPVLGKIGGQPALEAVRVALTSHDAGLAEAAARALCNWPDCTASNDLLRLAQNAGGDGRGKEALLALIRVNTVLEEHSAVERLAMLKKAMDLAPGVEERKKVLAGVATARHIEALRFALPYLDDKQLAQQACRTVVDLAHSKTLREPNRGIFAPALDRVIAMCQNPGLVERAQRYKEGK